MRRWFVVLAGFVTASPALAAVTACDIARAEFSSMHEAHLRAHEAGNRYIDDHPTGFLCDPSFLPLMQDEFTSLETERMSAALVRNACNKHFADEMDDYIPKLDAQLAKAKDGLDSIGAYCPAKP